MSPMIRNTPGLPTWSSGGWPAFFAGHSVAHLEPGEAVEAACGGDRGTLVSFATFGGHRLKGLCLYRQVFDAVLKLPRKQQAKVVEMAEGFPALHAKPG